MLDLLKLLDSRLGEPSTWAGIGTLLIAAHVSVDPGVWHTVTLWGTIGASALAAVLSEVGTGKTPAQIAQDGLAALIAAVRAAAETPQK